MVRRLLVVVLWIAPIGLALQVTAAKPIHPTVFHEFPPITQKAPLNRVEVMQSRVRRVRDL